MMKWWRGEVKRGTEECFSRVSMSNNTICRPLWVRQTSALTSGDQKMLRSFWLFSGSGSNPLLPPTFISSCELPLGQASRQTCTHTALIGCFFLSTLNLNFSPGFCAPVLLWSIGKGSVSGWWLLWWAWNKQPSFLCVHLSMQRSIT